MSSLEDIFFKTCTRQQINKVFTATYAFLIFPSQYLFLSFAVFTDFRHFYTNFSLIEALSLLGFEPGSIAWQSSAIPARHISYIYYCSVLRE
jgi:hypothetical protein